MRTVVKGNSDPAWFIKEVLGVQLFPMQEKLIRDFYINRYDSSQPQKTQLILEAGQRSGKTALASFIGLYEFFTLITLKDPPKHYGIIKGQPIFVTCVATSRELAEDGVFANMVNHIEDNEWFNQWFDLKIKETRIECEDKNSVIQVLGSWMTTAVGRTNKCAILDEVDYFEETSGKRGAWAIYEKLKNSTMTFGEDGHLVAISSPKTTSGIIRTLVNNESNNPRSLAVSIETWNMNPNITKESLMAEYKHNMSAFWRDFGCKPELAGSLQFPEGVKLVPMKNVLMDESYRDTEPIIRVMAIDPAYKNDAFGIACGYRHPLGDIIIDGVTKITNQGVIGPDDISNFIYRAIPRLNVNHFVFDTWMFPNIIEDVHTKFGIEPIKHIVGKEDYDRWRGLQESPNSYKLMVVENEDLRRECENLIVKSGTKVDHPTNGSKDMADCVSNCIWFLENNQTIDNMPQIVLVNTW